MTVSIMYNDYIIIVSIGLIKYESCITTLEQSSSLLKRLSLTFYYSFSLLGNFLLH